MKIETCRLIQWEQTAVDDKGNLVCPRCKEPAEMVLGVFGNPCYAHKEAPSKRTARAVREATEAQP